jgi:hypothetical protein
VKTIRETPPPPSTWAIVHDGETPIGEVLGTAAIGRMVGGEDDRGRGDQPGA